MFIEFLQHLMFVYRIYASYHREHVNDKMSWNSRWRREKKEKDSRSVFYAFLQSSFWRSEEVLIRLEFQNNVTSHHYNIRFLWLRLQKCNKIKGFGLYDLHKRDLGQIKRQQEEDIVKSDFLRNWSTKVYSLICFMQILQKERLN